MKKEKNGGINMSRNKKMHMLHWGPLEQSRYCNHNKATSDIFVTDNWLEVTCGNCLRLRPTPTGWFKRWLWYLFG